MGPDHLLTLRTITGLGDLYSGQGKLEEAEDLYRRALKRYEKAWGPDHRYTLSTVDGLGVLYGKQGKLNEAEDMFRRALKGYAKELGQDTTFTLIRLTTSAFFTESKANMTKLKICFDGR